MKTISLTVLFCVLFGCFDLHAQNACSDDLNVYDTWDWTQNENPAYTDTTIISYRVSHTTGISTVVDAYVPSPFDQDDNMNTEFLNDEQKIAKDFHPYDGWVLVRRKLGQPYYDYYSSVTNPYFILYNRYNATLRVFVFVTLESQANTQIDVSLQFNGAFKKASALLGAFEPFQKSVEDFVANRSNEPNLPDSLADSTVVMRVLNRSGSLFYWAVADFPMAYDPCTCTQSSKARDCS
jgi:hypothetical protein